MTYLISNSFLCFNFPFLHYRQNLCDTHCSEWTFSDRLFRFVLAIWKTHSYMKFLYCVRVFVVVIVW